MYVLGKSAKGGIPVLQLVPMQQRARRVRAPRQADTARVVLEACTPTPAEQVRRCGSAKLEALHGPDKVALQHDLRR
jgi:antitoxin (DNA-binding transcriptional repressor) of toxin-antitoxin stability system